MRTTTTNLFVLAILFAPRILAADKAALDTQYMHGVFWCNPVDTPKGFGNPGVKQGFFGEGLTERTGLHQAVRELNVYREKVTPAGGVK